MGELGTRPVEIIISISGKAVAYSNLLFHSRVYGSTAVIYVPINTQAPIGSKVVLSFRHEDQEQQFATLVVKSSDLGGVGVLHLLCKEPYHEAMASIVQATSWRKATVKEIASDILASAGVQEVDLAALPDAKLERFSYADQSAFSLLQSLRWAVRQAHKVDLVIVPLIDGKLAFGPLASIRPDFGYAITAETSSDVLWKHRGMFGLHVLPLLYGQEFTVDGIKYQASDVEIVVRPDKHETCVKVDV